MAQTTTIFMKLCVQDQNYRCMLRNIWEYIKYSEL